ncbi:MAG: glycine/sarcosine/betaine reductase selenoprotein B family protein [Dehalococcoidia bacterium]
MKPIDYVSILDSYYQGSGFPPYKWSVFRTTTWSPFEKPLEQAKVALLCSSGMSRKGQEPFDPLARSELSYREILKDTRAEDLVINYDYYDHRDADQDPNVILPLDRFRELEQEGLMGEPWWCTMSQASLCRI